MLFVILFSDPGRYNTATSVNSFVFSLKNNDNLEPFKASMYSTRNNLAIYNRFVNGPTFGYGHHFYISDNANSTSNSYTNLGHTYKLPAGYTPGTAISRALLAGFYRFTPSEVEVFYLQ